MSVGHNSVHDSVDFNVDYTEANEILHLKPDDIMYPKKHPIKKHQNTELSEAGTYSTILP